MRKLLLPAALLVLGCQGPTMTSSVALTAITSSPSLPARGTVTITLTLYNRSDHEMTVPLDDCLMRPFEVLDANGVVVGPARFQVCALVLYAPKTIPAGGSLSYTTTWRGDSRIGPTDALEYVAPGQYTIRGRVLIQENTYVYAPPVAITVTPGGADACACSLTPPSPDARSRRATAPRRHRSSPSSSR